MNISGPCLPDISITRADFNVPEHAAALGELLDHYAQEPMGGGKPLNRDVKEALPSLLAAREDTFTFLAFADSEAIALVNCFEGFSTFAGKPLINIHDVYVAPQWRGKGVAGLLFEQVELVAVERGACKLTLEVLSNNSSARAAYQKLGFSDYALDPSAGTAHFWQKPLE